jgi:20S proteasome subunit beta 2
MMMLMTRRVTLTHGAYSLQQVTKIISSQLELHRLTTGRQSRVITPCRMLKQMLYKYQVRTGTAACYAG